MFQIPVYLSLSDLQNTILVTNMDTEILKEIEWGVMAMLKLH
jgi:hypothetical protein